MISPVFHKILHHEGFPKRIMLYVGALFVLTASILVLSLTALISLFDFIDLLRRAASNPVVHLSDILKIAALHIPYYIIYVLPFGILLGGIVCFSRLARSSELVVMRAAGISAWQILGSPVLCGFIMGFLVVTCLSPLSSLCYRHAELLDEIWLRHGTGPMLLDHGSLWLRQADHGLVADGTAILHIGNLHLEGHRLHVYDVTILRLDANNAFLSRIEAREGLLYQQKWQFFSARLLAPAHLPAGIGAFSLPSELTVKRIRTRAAPPDTVSFWSLPSFITSLKKSGFPTLQHRLHLQALLALPVLAGTMALVSAGFSMRPAYRGGVAHIIGAGITAGFALFTISKIAEQLGKSGALPPVLAAWAPALAGLCLAASLLLHMEDG